MRRFNQMYPDADYQKSKYPGMHQTHTVDYAIILEGEIVAKMDQGETLMKVGDVLIQRGTDHAWINRSNKTARVAFVLIDAVPSEPNTQQQKIIPE